MKSILKFVIALLLSLSIPTVSFSQTTYPRIVNDSLILLTSSQLKHTNLIFAEHQMLLKQVDLLESQNRQYRMLVSNYEKQDSLQAGIIEANKELYTSTINRLNNDLKEETRKRKLTQIGWGGTVIAGIAALLLLK